MTIDDGYDEYDDYDERSAYAPSSGRTGAAERHGGIHDSEAVLRRVIDMIATARTIPLSSSPMINRDEIIELLETAVDRLPDELRQARWMLKEKQEFIMKTRREAEEILEAARVEAARMVQRTEVVRAAEQRARQVIDTAEGDSRRIRHETEDFIDRRLGSFEILLDKLTRTVHAGRERLSIGATAVSDAARPTGTDELARGFFDQDRG